MIKMVREKTTRVADVMTKDVVTLDVRTTVEVAARILAERRIGGAPVVSASGKAVGIVTRSDLLDPRHHGADATIEVAMTRVLYAVRPSDPLLTAVRMMATENIHRVIVADERGAVVGVVTSMDVMRAIAGADRHGEPQEPEHQPSHGGHHNPLYMVSITAGRPRNHRKIQVFRNRSGRSRAVG
jgi:predicted transcriptional regulator